MKKVLIVITTDYVSFGGLTTVMMNYYRKINKNKFKIDFASTNENIENSLMEELKSNGSNYYCLGERKKKVILYIRNLYKLLKQNKYDVIHVNSNSATAAIELSIAKLCNVNKRIVHNHTGKCDHKVIHRILYPLFIHLYTDAVACSKKAGDWIFKNRDYIILNNGIDCERYRYDDENRKKIRKQIGISDKCVLIGHVGKIYEPKNHPFLINIYNDIYKEYPNTKLLLVGDGEMRKQIEHQVEMLGLLENVIFVGMQSNVEDYLSAMDLFMFPSIWEGMPLSVIEAQASGIQCLISSNIDDAVCITKKIVMCSIASKQPWIDEFKGFVNYNRILQSDENIKMIKENGFDVELNVSKLEQLYLQ